MMDVIYYSGQRESSQERNAVTRPLINSHLPKYTSTHKPDVCQFLLQIIYIFLYTDIVKNTNIESISSYFGYYIIQNGKDPAEKWR